MIVKVLAITSILFLAACSAAPPPAVAADERQLTKEQDAEVAARCGDGCRIVPNAVWEQIVKALKGENI